MGIPAGTHDDTPDRPTPDRDELVPTQTPTANFSHCSVGIMIGGGGGGGGVTAISGNDANATWAK